MIIKNYFTQPKHSLSPCLDLQILENVTDVTVYANCYNAGEIGDPHADGVTTIYDTDPDRHKCGTTNMSSAMMTRRIDFTRNGIRCRLIVHNHAYVCNDEGRTVEKVSA